MRKKERCPVRGHELERPSSPPKEKEDKDIQLKLYFINRKTKSNLSLGHDDLVK